MATTFQVLTDPIEFDVSTHAAVQSTFVIGPLVFPAAVVPPHPDGTPASDHCQLALARLLDQFEDKPKLEGFICALADRGTAIEQALINVKEFRSLTTALGEQLDQLGNLYEELREGEDDDDYRRRLEALALVVASKGTGDELLDILIKLDNGFAPTTIELSSHFPASFIMTVHVPLGQQLVGEKFARTLKKAVAAGVGFQLQFEEVGATLFVWTPDTGAGFAEEDDLAGTGGIWAEGV